MFTNPNLDNQDPTPVFNQVEQKYTLSGSFISDSLILAKLMAEQKKNNGSGAGALIITDTQENAERIYSEINFLLS